MTGLVACYWLTPLPRAAVYLRRYTPGRHDCPGGHGYHDASQYIGRQPLPHGTHGYVRGAAPPHDDTRWPTRCAACGYTFAEDDVWQHGQHRLWAPPGSEASCRPLHEWGPGALYDATWYPDAWRGADGIALVARCPNGMDWTVDHVSSSGGRWQRTGDPRQPGTLQVQPSIAIGEPGSPSYYHGWLGVHGTPPGHFSAHLG